MTRLPFDPNKAVGGAGPTPPAASDAQHPLTVWQLTEMVKSAIEEHLPPTVHVVGQLSNFKLHTSGHLYFTLKDDRSEVACVMWRSAADRLKFKPADGMDVVVTGNVSVFERTGRYQLYARSIEPRGIGALEVAFRQLCEKLRAAGLFDPQHKKPLPKYPLRIAVVTSPTGAAVQDILDTLRRRVPCAAVLLHPVKVQGPGAAEEIARAIRLINRKAPSIGGVDVMIVGRGGGSIEDLWAFNEEVVARAIFVSAIPIISAVGHETDITVADLVADVRAATPTAAAELAVPRLDEVLEELDYRQSVLTRLVTHRLQLGNAAIEGHTRRRAYADPLRMISDRAQQITAANQRIVTDLGDRVHRLQRRMGELALAMHRLHPERYMESRRARLLEAAHRLGRFMDRRLAIVGQDLGRRGERLHGATPQWTIRVRQDHLVGLERQLRASEVHLLASARQRAAAAEARLNALGYKSTLERGFTITRAQRTGRVVRRPDQLRYGERLVTEFAEGTVESRVVDPDQDELFD
jgi:exodeoxyribonuclease VII large subunit